MYQLCERLKELRIRSGISQNKLAEKMDLTRATVNAWEMGLNSPNAQSIVMLAKFYKVSADYILGLDNSETVSIGHLSKNEKRIICELVECLSDKHK